MVGSVRRSSIRNSGAAEDAGAIQLAQQSPQDSLHHTLQAVSSCILIPGALRLRVILRLLCPSGEACAAGLALAELVDGALNTVELVDGLLAFGSEACLELPEGVTCLAA